MPPKPGAPGANDKEKTMIDKHPSRFDDRDRLGAAASIIQVVLFWVIAVAALAVGVDRFLGGGLGVAARERPVPFVILCVAFVAIAILGLAITPAEKALLDKQAPGPAQFGAALASLGHMGTIAFFSWWGYYALRPDGPLSPALANELAPVAWGLAFELGLVGAWVWIIAWVGARHRLVPRGFVRLSIAKALCFWFTLVAVTLQSQPMVVVGLGLTAVVVGPAWHLWVARLFPGPVDKLTNDESLARSKQKSLVH
jgi:hypothetical protein